MSERKAIERTQAPHTRRSLGTDLTSIGVTEGYVVLVHSSFSAIGWVCGGPVTLIQALLKRSDGWADGGVLVKDQDHLSSWSWFAGQ